MDTDFATQVIFVMFTAITSGIIANILANVLDKKPEKSDIEWVYKLLNFGRNLGIGLAFISFVVIVILFVLRFRNDISNMVNDVGDEIGQGIENLGNGIDEFINPYTPTPSPTHTSTPTNTPTPTFTPTPDTVATYQAQLTIGVSDNDKWQVETRRFEGILMVLVPPGCFYYGWSYECIEEPYWIDKDRVWNEQFGTAFECDIFIQCSVSYPNKDNRNNYRGGVSLEDAIRLCQSRGGDIPTDIQWTYAQAGPDSEPLPDVESKVTTWTGMVIVPYELTLRSESNRLQGVQSLECGL